MLQRKQSIFILLAILSLVINVIISPTELTINESVVKYNWFGWETNGASEAVIEQLNNMEMMFLAGYAWVAGILVGILSLFSFKKRPVQIKLNWIGMGLVVLGISLTALDLKQIHKDIEHSLPLINLVIVFDVLLFFNFANKGIKKDEDLVKSVDRIR